MHRAIAGLAVGVVLAAAAPTLALAQQAAPKRTRIAVLDVQYAGVGDRKTVEGLSALIASDVSGRPDLMVIAGADLRALIGFEKQKQLLGCSEGNCIAELAGALGVTYLISSEASMVGKTWLLSLTLLDASKAMAVARLTRKAYSDDALVEETTKAVNEILRAVPVASTRVVTSAGPATPPAPAKAEVPPPATPPGERPRGWRSHDGGYLNVHLGLGRLASVAPGTATTMRVEASGVCGTFSVSGGFAPIQNLVLFAEVFSDVDASPDLKIAGATSPGGGLTHSVTGYGAGAAYYLASFNGYGRLMLGAASTTLENEVTNMSSRRGLALRLGVGKEWWISDNWGVGAGLDLLYTTAKAKEFEGTWKTTSFGVVVSATFN